VPRSRLVAYDAAVLTAPDLKRYGFAGDIASGLSLPFRAFAAVFSETSLFLLTALSAAITLIVLLGLFLFVTHVSPVDAFWSEPTAWYARAAYFTLKFVLGTVVFAVGALTLPLLATVPLQDTISKRTEVLLGVETAKGGLGRLAKEISNSLAHTAGRVLVLYAGQLALLLLLFIPGLGQVAWTVLSWLWSVWWLAGEYLDIPMSRHLHRFGDVRRVLRGRPALCLAFGAVLYVMLFVPIVNCFVIPVAVVAGTMLYRGLVAAGEV
jgi:CysZ protein